MAVAVPPQFDIKLLGLATTRPGGVGGSLKATPVKVTVVFGFEMVKVTVEVPPGRNFAGEKVSVIEGGAATVMLAVPAVQLLPPLVEATVTELF